MATVNTAASPYYDDYNANDNYYRIMFRGGRAVQARELSQLQTALQQQIKYHGDHVFRDGSPVLNGESDVVLDCQYVRLYDNIGVNDAAGTAANVFVAFDTTTFDGIEVQAQDAGGTAGVTDDGRQPFARVIQVSDRDVNDPKTLILSYSSGDQFKANDVIVTMDNTIIARVEDFTTSATSATGNSSIFTVAEGVYYAKGYFIHTTKQSVILSKYTDTPTYKVGLTYNESIVDAITDSTLYDNAQGTYNLNAPGADRLKIQLDLSLAPGSDGVSISDKADANFFELARIVDGATERAVFQPIYSELGNQLAQRTYEESGDYVVHEFNADVSENNPIEPNSKLNIGVSPGTAYVRGHRAEILDRTILTVNKPRTSVDMSSEDALDLGSYVIVSNVTNQLFSTSDYPIVDIHFANNTGLESAGDVPKRANSVIANARITSILPIAPDARYPNHYKVYLSDIRSNVISTTATSPATDGTTSSFLQVGATDVPQSASGVDLTLFVGSRVTVTDPNSQVFGRSARLVSRTGTNPYVFTLDPPLGGLAAGESVEITTDIAKARSLRIGTAGAADIMADVANIGKVGLVATGDTKIFQAQQTALVFPLDNTEGIRTLPTVSYRSSGSGITTHVAGTSFPYSAASLGFENFDARTLEEAVFSNSAVGAITPTGLSLTGSGSPYTLTVTFEESPLEHSFHLTGTVSQASSSLGLKTKAEVTGNTLSTVIGAAENLSTGRGEGRVVFSVPNKTRGRKDNLGTSDVLKIRKVIDTLQTVVQPNTFHLSDSTYDVTSRYMLDTGQRDTIYDHASVMLRPGANPPTGQLAVIFDYYTHGGSSNGYFSVDSYSTVNNSYSTIASYTTDAGFVIPLRDSLDFRPRRTDVTGTAAVNSSNRTDTFYLEIQGKNSPVDQSIAVYGGTKYVPRKDNIVIGYDGNLRVLEGVAEEDAVAPPDSPDSLVLYTVSYPSYVFNVNDVILTPHNNRRYTMKDIGRMKSQLSRLANYVALNQLEVETNQLSILDSTGTIDRFKNGILTDNFDSLVTADILSGDYRAAIDPMTGILKPAQKKKSFDMYFIGGSDATLVGGAIFPTYTQLPFITQAMASESVPANQDTSSYKGTLIISPSSDIFIDNQVFGTQPGFSVAGNDDITQYVDVSQTEDETLGPIDLSESAQIQANFERPGHLDGARITVDHSQEAFFLLYSGGQTVRQNEKNFTSSARTSDYVPVEVPVSDVMGYIRSQTTPGYIVGSDVGFVVDTSVIPYIREQGLSLLASGMKSNTKIYAYFDSRKVNMWTARANEITVSEPCLYDDTENMYEYIKGSTTGAEGRLIATRSTGGANVAYIISSNGAFNPGDTITAPYNEGTPPNVRGNSTAITVRSYRHYSGQAQGGAALTITLNSGSNYDDIAALQANTDGGFIYIVAGKGVGQKKKITGYNNTTKIATVSSAWAANGQPDSTSVYSLGELRTTNRGEFMGVFTIPLYRDWQENARDDAWYRFTTGMKPLRLMDVPSGRLDEATTTAESYFFASGQRTVMSPRPQGPVDMNPPSETVPGEPLPVPAETEVNTTEAPSGGTAGTVETPAGNEPTYQRTLFIPQLLRGDSAVGAAIGYAILQGYDSYQIGNGPVQPVPSGDLFPAIN